MKVNLQPPVWPVVRQRINRWTGRPGVETGLRFLAAMGAGFVLAGVSVAGTWMPLAISLAAALGLGLPAFGAYGGSCLGYLLFWDATIALEPMAAGLLVVSCHCVFGDLPQQQQRWYVPMSAMVFPALVGFLFLLEQRFAVRVVWRAVLRVAVGGGGAVCFWLALHRDHRFCRLILLACLCGGACALDPVGLPLGAVAACALTAAALETPMALPMAVLCGLALDLSWQSGCATAVLTLGALVGQHRNRLLRLGIWLCAVLAGVVLTGTSSLLLASAMLGAALSLPVSGGDLFGTLPAVRSREDQRRQTAAGLLDQLCHCLEPDRIPRADPETAAVFDQAAERVCRMCSLWDDCWNQNVRETVEALDRASPAMMTRGKALREDFPALFSNRCRHLEGFITAVNRELDDLSCRRQCRSRIRESRRVLVRQYGVLAQALARDLPDREVPCRFQPEVGYRSRGRREDAVSGDRGATFRLGSFYYLILCDGMGTGPGAAAEAGAAISILRTLLQSGAEPEEAMDLLNGIYILRDDGCFATVDLLQADLVTGDAALFKWGAAPSYVKRRSEVEKIGTAAPPPGLGVGEAHQPEVTRLSLARGEMLVLTSDGAGGEAAERFLRQYGGLSPKELASGIVSCCQNPGEDDRTAAVVTLRPRSLLVS